MGAQVFWFARAMRARSMNSACGARPWRYVEVLGLGSARMNTPALAPRRPASHVRGAETVPSSAVSSGYSPMYHKLPAFAWEDGDAAIGRVSGPTYRLTGGV